MNMLLRKVGSGAIALTLAAGFAATTTLAAEPVIGLITKTETNPFFVKMKEGFEAKAKELGLTPPQRGHAAEQSAVHRGTDAKSKQPGCADASADTLESLGFR